MLCGTCINVPIESITFSFISFYKFNKIIFGIYVMYSNKTKNKSHWPILIWPIEVGIGVKNSSSVDFVNFVFYIP